MFRFFVDKCYHVVVFGLLLVGSGSFNSVEAQVQTIVKYPSNSRPAKLIAEVSHLNYDSTKVYRLFDDLSHWLNDHPDPFLEWYLRFLKVSKEQEFRIPNITGRIAYLIAQKEIFEHCPFGRVKAAYYSLLGTSYFVNKNFSEAFKYSLQAEQLLEDIGYENIPEATAYLDLFFYQSYWFEDYRKALEYALLVNRYNRYGIIKTPLVLNNLGLVYLQLHRYEEAAQTFRKALSTARVEQDSIYVGLLSGNYGNTLRLQGKYAASLPFLYTDVRINGQVIQENSAISRLYIAQSLLQLDSVSKAKKYIDAATLTSKELFWSNLKKVYYETQALYFERTGQYETGLRYKDSLLILKDSLHRLFDFKIFTAAQANKAAANHLRELQRIEIEQSLELWKRNLLILGLGAGAVVIVLIFDQRRRRELLLQQAERKRAEDQLQYASEQLDEYLLYIKQKNELIEKMNQELAEARRQAVAVLPNEEATQRLQQQVILTDDDWRKFRQLFQQVYPHFFEQLQSTYPDLSPAEVRLLALLKLNLGSSEMANMLGISLASLRTARYRLRKKIHSLPLDRGEMQEWLSQL